MSAAVARFRRVITDALGLQLDDNKLPWLAEVLERRVGSGVTEAYLDALADPQRGRAELRELTRELTVGETYFFRHAEQFRAFAETVLPALLAAHPATRELRLLSAGCASGEEAYTLAMLLLEHAPGRKASVRAVDVSPAALEKARRARYGTWALRDSPDAARRRHFVERGRDFDVDPTVRALVTFEERNLSVDDDDLWRPGAYDVVFCRNVLMYFAPEAAQRVVARIHRALAPDGHLFLGHAETLRGLSSDFHLCHTHDAFYYQRKAADEAQRAPELERSDAAPLSADWAATWLETVRRSAEKIRALSEQPATDAAPREHADDGRHATLALLAEERFGEALDRLGTDRGGDPETLLIRAVLLAQRGDTPAAEAMCERLLALDELSAGAHYVLALCRESAGDLDGACDHDRIAVYLDPGFAMPRLHLGLIARRGGDREGAVRELTQAALLLRREDASRVLMFGGGFGRDALIALCRAELSAGGAR